MKKLILIFGMCLVLLSSANAVLYQPIFMDHFSDSSLANQGWTSSSTSESGTVTYATSPSGASYIDSDTWGNISLFDEDWSMQLYVKQAAVGVSYNALWIGTGSTTDTGDGISLRLDGANTNTINLRCFGGCSCTSDTTSNTADTSWHVAEYIFNATNKNITLYKDGVRLGKGIVVSGCNLTSMNVGLKHRDESPQDQVDWINISTLAEGSTPPPAFVAPTPTDGARNTTNKTFNMTESSPIVDAHTFLLYMDTNADPTTLVYNDTDGNFTSQLTTDGVYYYKAQILNTVTGSYSDNTSTRTYTLDRISPYAFINPNNFFTASNVSTQDQYSADTVQFNITYTDNTDLYGFDINITDGTNTVYNNTNLTLSGSTEANWTQTINVSSWAPYDYDVILYVADPHHYKGGYQIGEYDTVKTAEELTFKTTEGNEIKIRSPDATSVTTTKAENSYEFTYQYERESTYRSYEVTSNTGIVRYHPESRYKAHFTIYNRETKHGNWVDFEGVTGKYAIEKIKSGYRINFYDMIPTKETITRSIGGLNVRSYNYTWYKGNATLIEDNHISGTAFTLYLNVTRGGDISDLNASFSYNGTPMTVSESVGTGHNLYSVSFPSGVTVGNNTLINYSWTVNVTRSDSSTYSFDENSSHYIYYIGLGLCTDDAYNHTILNFTYFDEQDESALTVNATYNLIFNNDVLAANQTGSFTNSQHNAFCTDRDPSSITHEWNVTGTYTIGTDGYVTRIYTWNEGNEILATNKPPTNQSLYLILINQSTTIQYNWLTTSYTLVDGVMEIYSCADDGDRLLVESTPITSGVAVANIEIITQPYSYEVIIDGETYIDNSFYACHLEPDNEATYYVDVTEIGINPVFGLYLIDCTMTKVSNTTAMMQWNDNAESTDTITACIVGYDNTGAISTLVYEDCTTTGHTLTSTIPATVYTVKGRLKQGDVTAFCSETLVYKNDDNFSSTVGINGAFAIALLLMTAALVYAGNDLASLILPGITIILGFVFGITSIGWIGTISIAIFLLLIGIIGRMNRK